MAKYILIRTADGIKRFLKKTEPNIRNNIEYKRYGKSKKVLITAEHAKIEKHILPRYGKDAYAVLGDNNTGKIARIAAHYGNCRFISTTLSRYYVDLCRPPGKHGTLRVKVNNSEKDFTRLPINWDKESIKVAKTFHRTIEKMNPRIILSYHGMHTRSNTDILLGFGPERSYSLGNKNAFKFRKFYKEMLREKLLEMGLRTDIIIKIGKNLFTGTKNYTLFKHIQEYNKKHSKKRLGVHVEFDRRGRKMKKYPPVPRLRYQVAGQVLVDSAKIWEKENMD